MRAAALSVSEALPIDCGMWNETFSSSCVRT